MADFYVQTSRLTHGTTQTSFSIETQRTDVSQYIIWGQTPSKLTLNVASGLARAPCRSTSLAWV